MKPGTWDRLEAVFFEALTLPPESRASYLDRACAGDPELRAEVEAVLASHLALGDDTAEPVTPESRVGTRVGAYRLEALIGRGGMGEVYRARRADEQYEHEVAVKIVRSGLSPFEMVRRFRQERQILARLEHRNVATLLDGGVTAEGQPYLVMQYVRGRPITEYVDAHRLPIRERLRLFVTVCRAVQFAHANFVVHRDLKPSNILVTDEGEVRLLDFGIAKLLDPEGSDATLPTESLLLMTPEHAAPEQFLGQPITTATDVYQLGVLLYQLLAGTRPFQAESQIELSRAICEQEPTRPSAAVGQPPGAVASDTVGEADAARLRSTTPEHLRRQLRGDLDRIVLMALRKDPSRRYGSAADLADDIERHLEGFPVRARPETFTYVAGRFLRRHRAAVTVGGALVASLVALVVLSLRFAATTSAQARAIAAERDVAVEVSSFLESLFEASDPFAAGGGRRDTLHVRAFLDEGARKVREGLADQPMVQARMLSVLGKAWRNLGQLNEAKPLLEEAARITANEAGEDSPDAAITRVSLAQLLQMQGELEAAQPLVESSIAVLGRDSVAHAAMLANALGVLGNVHQEAGRYVEAEQAYRRALTLATSDSALDPGLRAEYLSNLATALSRQSKLEEAAGLLQTAVGLARTHSGNEHPTTARMLNNLGSVLRDANRNDEAEAALRESLAIMRARFEPPHPTLAVSINNLGDLLLFKGDLAGAEQLFRESLEMRRALYGERHPSVAVGWINLAAVLQRMEGRANDAVNGYNRARTILHETVGPTHPTVAAIEGNLARLYHNAGDHERALRHLELALEIRRGALAGTHPLVLATLSDIGLCQLDVGRRAEAERTLLEAFAGLEPQKDEQRRLFDGVLQRLARLYRELGREDEAARYEAMRDTTSA